MLIYSLQVEPESRGYVRLCSLAETRSEDCERIAEVAVHRRMWCSASSYWNHALRHLRETIVSVTARRQEIVLTSEQGSTLSYFP